MTALSYSDIYLTPRYSTLCSRSEADISVEFLGYRFVTPVVPSNMSSVINEDIAKQLSESGAFYIMHRFSDTSEFVLRANRENWKIISISIGVKQADKDLLTYLASGCHKIHFITIDIAHGHSILVKEMIEFIKELYTRRSFMSTPKIIAGNVATPEAVCDLASWGADAVKVGIANGAACTTYHQTGFGAPMFSCVYDCINYGGFGSKNTPMGNLDGSPMKIYQSKISIIADGGIRENGDIAKALVAGATLVMAGSIFAACTDAPGENLYQNFRQYGMATDDNRPPTHKSYHGSASEHEKGERKNIEGIKIDIPCNGLTYAEKYQDIKESLQSAISYAGGTDLTSFKYGQYISTK